MTRAHAVLWLVAALFLVPIGAHAQSRVSLGDSYSAGEGAGDYERDSGSCHRTPNAWPRMLGVRREHHLACSGARIDHIDTVAQKRTGPNSVPQLDRLRSLGNSSAVGTVLLTIGGNDLRFKRKLLKCRFIPRACLTNPRELDGELAKVGSRLIKLYRTIVATAKARRLVVVGYPDIAPSAREQPSACRWMRDTEVRSRIEHFAQRLDETLAGAASRAGVVYVSVRDVLDDHELCTKDSWMFPVFGDRDFLSQQQGHPTEEGQDAVAAKVRAALRKLNRQPGTSCRRKGRGCGPTGR
jgi:hypothetical protein